MPARISDEEAARRFWARVAKDRDGGCWVWTGPADGHGVPVGVLHRRWTTAARLAYELAYGPLPDGVRVERLCANPLCVRPEHHAVNTLDALKRRQIPKFWMKVNKRADISCWDWTGCPTHGGYGRFVLGRRSMGAHRASYEIAYGPIPDGMFVMHTCDRPCCVRPEHLRVGLPRENTQDMIGKGRRRDGIRQTPARGECNPSAKVTREQVASIIRRFRAGEATGRALAREFGISPSAVSAIVTGANWGWLEDRPSPRAPD